MSVDKDLLKVPYKVPARPSATAATLVNGQFTLYILEHRMCIRSVDFDLAE